MEAAVIISQVSQEKIKFVKSSHESEMVACRALIQDQETEFEEAWDVYLKHKSPSKDKRAVINTGTTLAETLGLAFGCLVRYLNKWKNMPNALQPRERQKLLITRIPNVFVPALVPKRSQPNPAIVPAPQPNPAIVPATQPEPATPQPDPAIVPTPQSGEQPDNPPSEQDASETSLQPSSDELSATSTEVASLTADVQWLKMQNESRGEQIFKLFNNCDSLYQQCMYLEGLVEGLEKDVEDLIVDEEVNRNNNSEQEQHSNSINLTDAIWYPDSLRKMSYDEFYTAMTDRGLNLHQEKSNLGIILSLHSKWALSMEHAKSPESNGLEQYNFDKALITAAASEYAVKKADWKGHKFAKIPYEYFWDCARVSFINSDTNELEYGQYITNPELPDDENNPNKYVAMTVPGTNTLLRPWRKRAAFCRAVEWEWMQSLNMDDTHYNQNKKKNLNHLVYDRVLYDEKDTPLVVSFGSDFAARWCV